MTTFLRVLRDEDKEAALRLALDEHSNSVLEVDPSEFEALSTSRSRSGPAQRCACSSARYLPSSLGRGKTCSRILGQSWKRWTVSGRAWP
jgi:hypothetical protein